MLAGLCGSPRYRGGPLIGRSPSTPFFKIKSYLIEDITHIELTYVAGFPSLLLDRRSIDLSGAREKEGHFHYKNFLRASK